MSLPTTTEEEAQFTRTYEAAGPAENVVSTGWPHWCRS